MVRSRRSLLQGVGSLAASALLGDLSSKAQAPVGCTPSSTRPATFNPGVRVFFCGPWLFCKAKGDGMLAITQDLQKPLHTFSAGVWDSANEHIPNPRNLDPSAQSRFEVNPVDYTAQKSWDDLLASSNLAAKRSFLYFKSDDGTPLTVSTSGDTVRVIHLPIPTDIIPGAYLSNVVPKEDPKNTYRQKFGCLDVASTGVPTMHILVFDGATGLTLTQGQQNLDNVSLVGNGLDYHFHVVPPKGIPSGDIAHPRMTFDSVFSLIKHGTGNSKNTSIDLISGENSIKTTMGLDVPTTVDECEAQLALKTAAGFVTKADIGKYLHSHRRLVNAEIASCAGPGGIVGGDGGGTT